MPAAQVFLLPNSFEDSSGYILARVVGMAAANITVASISSIQLKVYDVEDVAGTPTEVASRSITVDSTVIFDTLQTGSGWDLTEDADGFNFKVEVLPADIPAGGKTYRFEFKFTDTNSKIWHVVVDVPTLGLIRS